MKITTIEDKDTGGVSVSTKSLEDVRSEYEANGYKVVNKLNTHIEDGRYVFGGYDMSLENPCCYDNVRIVEHKI